MHNNDKPIDDCDIIAVSDEVKEKIALLIALLQDLAEYASEAIIGKYLDVLLRKCSYLYAHIDLDDDSDTYYLSGPHRNDSDYMQVSSDELMQAVVTGWGKEPHKQCRRCGEYKRLVEFSFSVSSRDKRNNYCLVCERQRVREYGERRRRLAKALAEKIEGKTCLACQRYLVLGEFHKDKSMPDGHKSWCKACRRARGV